MESHFQIYGENTILPKTKPAACQIGQRNGFSDTDIRKINSLYKCSGYPQVGSNAKKLAFTVKKGFGWMNADGKIDTLKQVR